MKKFNIVMASIITLTLAGCASNPGVVRTPAEVSDRDEKPRKLSPAYYEAVRDANLNNAMVKYIEDNKLANDPNWKGKVFEMPDPNDYLE